MDRQTETDRQTVGVSQRKGKEERLEHTAQMETEEVKGNIYIDELG